MTLAGWELLGTALLVLPSGFSAARLWLAYVKEWQAGQAAQPGLRRFRSAEARRLASVASLFPPVVLLSFSLGIAIQVAVLAAKIFFA